MTFWSSANQDSVEFLGHVVSKDGVQVDPKKVSVIRDWPPLKMCMLCNSFWGLNQRLVAFHSYKFSSAEINYGSGESVGEQKMLAVISALRQWRCHLEGAKEVVVFTDHKPNTYLDSKPSVQLSRRQVAVGDCGFHHRPA
ncbi:hypothetical protein WJX82_001521 [Trebouxia sp. C0006]